MKLTKFLRQVTVLEQALAQPVQAPWTNAEPGPILLQSTADLNFAMKFMKCNGQLGEKLSVYGALMSTLRGYWAYEAVVDGFPHIKSMVLRPNKDKMKSYPFTCKDIYLFTTDEGNLAELISHEGVIPWNESFGVARCPLRLKSIFEDEAVKFGVSTWINNEVFHPHVLKEDHVIRPDRRLPDGFTVGSLDIGHAPLVLSHWASARRTTGEEWLPRIEHMIRHHPTSCVFDPRGDPASWVLSYFDWGGAMGYTLPEHRGKGVYVHVAADRVWKYLQAGIPLCSFFAEHNTAIKSSVGRYYDKLDTPIVFLSYIPLVAKSFV